MHLPLTTIMLDNLPFDVFYEISRLLPPTDRWNLADTFSETRYALLGERYQYLVINRQHFVPERATWNFYEIGFPKEFSSGRLPVPYDDHKYLMETITNMKSVDVFPFLHGNFYILIHWSNEVAGPTIELLLQLHSWLNSRKIQLRIIRHENNNGLDHDDVPELDVFFTTFTTVRLSNTMYQWLGKADFVAGVPTNFMRFEIPYQEYFIPSSIAEYKLPGDVRKVEIMAKPKGRFLRFNIATLATILKANWKGRITNLSVVGWHNPPAGPLPRKIVIPPSIMHLNHNLHYCNIDIVSDNVTHLYVKRFVEAKNLRDYVSIVTYTRINNLHERLMCEKPLTLANNVFKNYFKFPKFPNVRFMECFADYGSQYWNLGLCWRDYRFTKLESVKLVAIDHDPFFFQFEPTRHVKKFSLENIIVVRHCPLSRLFQSNSELHGYFDKVMNRRYLPNLGTRSYTATQVAIHKDGTHERIKSKNDYNAIDRERVLFKHQEFCSECGCRREYSRDMLPCCRKTYLQFTSEGFRRTCKKRYYVFPRY